MQHMVQQKRKREMRMENNINNNNYNIRLVDQTHSTSPSKVSGTDKMICN